MIGTFHLGISNNVMFGGINESEEHNNLIGAGEYNWKE